MKIRFFDWRDLPILLRYRNRGLFFDCAQVLTRGPMLVPAGAMLSYFAPATGIFTYLRTKNGDAEPPIIGQVMHPFGSAFARLSFLAPEAAMQSTALAELLEYMIARIGERGAFHMLAETDEHGTAFDALHQASFAIFARQRIWKLDDVPGSSTDLSPWQEGTERDLMAVRCLYNNLVPGLVQQVEPPPNDNVHGVVYREGGELLAYVEIKYGSRGIWVQPFVHPDAEHVPPRMGVLLQNLPRNRSRNVYVCVRSYQSWLEAALEALNAQPSPPQAVMVKHLAVAKRVAPTFALRHIEGGQPEATVPLARTENNHS
jgi:hypothetical protein